METPPNELNERTTHLVGFDLRRMLERVRDLSVAADKARAMAEHLEHQRKVILAKQREKHRLALAGQKVTEARLDDLARCSETYANHLGAMLEARDQQAESYAQYSAARAAYDLALRQMSFAQTEARLEAAHAG